MKYYATVEGHTFEIVIEGSGRITVDGVEMTADMQAVGRPDLRSLLLDHVSYEVVVESDASARNLYSVLVGGAQYQVKVQDERARRLAQADRSVRAPAGELAIKSPIPGLIVKTLVAPGQTVAEGETLLILEAMKMENELRAPRAGVVHEVRVEAGAQAALGQVLVTLY
jgi:biotin carboxyl carrier protein